MQAWLKDGRDVLAPPLNDANGPLSPMLLLLTVLTGLVDAVSYLQLGHVFVANMTGNVVFLGFALARGPRLFRLAIDHRHCRILSGAVAGGRLSKREGIDRPRLLGSAVWIKMGFVMTAMIVAFVLGPSEPTTTYACIVLLGLAMGLQNAVARKIAVPDLTTTVLTLTITGLAADSALAGGASPRPMRRILSVLAMLLGAAIGGSVLLRVGLGAALACAAAILVLMAGLVIRHSTVGPGPAWKRFST
jgi:uncharacterized membrane protein YoaK (UPF0700 family)